MQIETYIPALCTYLYGHNEVRGFTTARNGTGLPAHLHTQPGVQWRELWMATRLSAIGPLARCRVKTIDCDVSSP